jgi:hypothetical protein
VGRTPILRLARGQRKVAADLAIVIVGVFVALIAQQAVQSLDWQAQVRDSRKALRAELAYDVGAYDVRVRQSRCVQHRLDQLQQWMDQWKAGNREILGPIGRIYTFSLYDSVWNVVQSGQVAAHFPLSERLEYARLYDNLRNVDSQNSKGSSAWALLRGYEGARDLEHRDLIEISGAISELRLVDKVIRENGPGYIWNSAEKLNVQPEHLPVPGPIDELCSPLPVS